MNIYDAHPRQEARTGAIVFKVMPPLVEVGVILANLGQEPVTIERGMRIAQMIVAPVSRAVWQQTEALPDSVRGTGGFGSTGTETTSGRAVA